MATPTPANGYEDAATASFEPAVGPPSPSAPPAPPPPPPPPPPVLAACSPSTSVLAAASGGRPRSRLRRLQWTPIPVAQVVGRPCFWTDVYRRFEVAEADDNDSRDADDANHFMQLHQHYQLDT